MDEEKHVRQWQRLNPRQRKERPTLRLVALCMCHRHPCCASAMLVSHTHTALWEVQETRQAQKYRTREKERERESHSVKTSVDLRSLPDLNKTSLFVGSKKFLVAKASLAAVEQEWPLEHDLQVLLGRCCTNTVAEVCLPSHGRWQLKVGTEQASPGTG